MPTPLPRVFVLLLLGFLIQVTPLNTVAYGAEKIPNRVPGPMVLPTAKPGGDTFPSGLFSIKNHFVFANPNMYKGSSRYDYKTPSGKKVGPKQSDQFANVLKLRYGTTDRLELNTATPFINAEIKNHGGDENWMGGIGDTTLMLRYGLKKTF